MGDFYKNYRQKVVRAVKLNVGSPIRENMDFLEILLFKHLVNSVSEFMVTVFDLPRF